MKNRSLYITLFLLFYLPFSLTAQGIDYLGITGENDVSFVVGSGDKMQVIRRVMRPCGKNRGFLQPLSPAQGVTTVTEMDMLHAFNDTEAMIVDMRLESNFINETIPYAVNFPYVDIVDHMDGFGCKKISKSLWDCKDAKKIYVFCNGPACTQSPIGIRAIIKHGFPAKKVFYYRGGMLVWSAIGLPLVEGDF